MKLGDFRKSVEGMAEEAGLTIKQAKKLKLRITQAVFDGDLYHVRTDEKEITGIALDPDVGELVISVSDVYSPKEKS